MSTELRPIDYQETIAQLHALLTQRVTVRVDAGNDMVATLVGTLLSGEDFVSSPEAEDEDEEIIEFAVGEDGCVFRIYQARFRGAFVGNREGQPLRIRIALGETSTTVTVGEEVT